ncbi:cytoplasmic protein [Flavivirga spongiicola]|uniref:Cytoplasmic protein n=1 Tax=Flavivirga spongiicola TaxID=421621 RepID=A0ABU7XVJ1_9FLAO|nr:cytoplasmic protein [Flavivirga sp. MEBiC05379]MDO5978945.1 cytoplasmic protein [Flavivirga sp. MEBiC05379]
MEIKRASKYSIYNMSELEKTNKAGCYHCKSTFDTSEILETTDDGKTAMCPKCGIDSVLPDSSPFKLDKKTLTKLNNYWF